LNQALFNMAHGGARKGAGAKPKAIVQAKQNFAASILDSELEEAMWREMLNATRSYYSEGMGEPVTEPDYKIRLDALKYLSDQKYGKAPQSVKIGGDDESPIKLLLIGAKGGANV
jgi:hypothetical protein